MNGTSRPAGLRVCPLLRRGRRGGVRPPTRARDELIDDSHFGVSIRRCSTCRQRFVHVFTEFVDWADGDDPQYGDLLPVTDAEAAGLAAQGGSVDLRALEALGATRRRLVMSFPRGGRAACPGSSGGCRSDRGSEAAANRSPPTTAEDLRGDDPVSYAPPPQRRHDDDPWRARTALFQGCGEGSRVPARHARLVPRGRRGRLAHLRRPARRGRRASRDAGRRPRDRASPDVRRHPEDDGRPRQEGRRVRRTRRRPGVRPRDLDQAPGRRLAGALRAATPDGDPVRCRPACRRSPQAREEGARLRRRRVARPGSASSVRR